MKLQTIITSTILTAGIVISANAIATGSHSSEHMNKESMPMKHDKMNGKMNGMDHKNMDHDKMMTDMGHKNLMTMPAEGEMLMGSPKSIMLHFKQPVTLNSVTLYNEDDQALDIQFELSDLAVKMYEQTITPIAEGTFTVKYFYTNSDDEFEQGEFWFMVH